MAQQSLEAELRTLRLAAEQDDWSGCVAATERLLQRLPANSAVLLVREQVVRRLPLFERHQPGVHWPREVAESIQGLQPGPDDREWPEEQTDFPGPGLNNLASAVEHLWRASHQAEDAQRRTDHLGSAVAGAILAEQTESWGVRHPTEWARWYELASGGSSDPLLFDVQRAMNRDPACMRLVRAAWLEVAEWLEQALGATES